MTEWTIRYKLLDSGNDDAPFMCETVFERDGATLAACVDEKANALLDHFLSKRGLKRGEEKPMRRQVEVVGEGAAVKLGGYEGHNLAMHEFREELADGKHGKGKGSGGRKGARKASS